MSYSDFVTVELIQRTSADQTSRRESRLRDVLKNELNTALLERLAGDIVMPRFRVLGPEGDSRLVVKRGCEKPAYRVVYDFLAAFSQWEFAHSIVTVQQLKSGDLVGFYLCNDPVLASGCIQELVQEHSGSKVDLTFDRAKYASLFLRPGRSYSISNPTLPLEIRGIFDVPGASVSTTVFANVRAIFRQAQDDHISLDGALALAH